MALISIIIGLLFDRAFRHLHDLRDLSWFEYYSNAVVRIIKANGVVQIIAILLFPVLVIATIQLLLSDFLLELPYLLFSVLIIGKWGPSAMPSNTLVAMSSSRYWLTSAPSRVKSDARKTTHMIVTRAPRRPARGDSSRQLAP